LSFALAGLFGLNIFVISLLEPTLTESDLIQLFNNLPKRCIVLLEDIDTAGLSRDEKNDEKEDEHSPTEEEPKDDKFSAADLAKELKKAGRRSGSGGSEEFKQGISLSGLLNAIDGVASHEGRVLVMTTNHPEKLDSALIRPGRVDMQVAFTLATKHQTREIFLRMYSTDRLAATKKRGGNVGLQNGGGAGLANGHAKAGANGHLGANGSLSQSSGSALQELAERFANLVPEGKFSPAEVQNFLITRKKDPQRAMNEVEKWRDELLEAKGKKSKLVSVQ